MAAATVTFDGDNDQSWSDGANWDGDLLPTDDDDTIVPDGTNVVLGSGSASAESLDVGAGASGSLIVSGGASLTLDGNSSEGTVGGLDAGVLRINAGASFTLSDGSLSGVTLIDLNGGILTLSAGQSLSAGAIQIASGSNILLGAGATLSLTDCDGFEVPTGATLSAADATIELASGVGSAPLSFTSAIGTLTLDPSNGGFEFSSDLNFNTAFDILAGGNDTAIENVSVTGAQDATLTWEAGVLLTGSVVTIAGDSSISASVDSTGSYELILHNNGTAKSFSATPAADMDEGIVSVRGAWNLTSTGGWEVASLTVESTSLLATSVNFDGSGFGFARAAFVADSSSCDVTVDCTVEADELTLSGTNGAAMTATVNADVYGYDLLAVNAGSTLINDSTLYTEDTISIGATSGGMSGGVLQLLDGSEIVIDDGGSLESGMGSVIRSTTGSLSGAPTIRAGSGGPAFSSSISGTLDINGLTLSQNAGSADHVGFFISQSASITAFNYVRWTWSNAPSGADFLHVECNASLSNGGTLIGHSFDSITGVLVQADAGAVTALSIAFRDFLYDGTNNPSSADPTLAAANSLELNNAQIIWYGVATWQGDVGPDWTDVGNWDIGRVPGVGDDVVIPAPSGGNVDPILDGADTVYVNDIEVQAGATISISGTLHVTGSAMFDGETPVGMGTLIFDGNEDASVSGGFASESDLALIFAKTGNATLTLNASLATSGDISVGAGTLDISNGELHLAGDLLINGTLTNTGTGMVEFTGAGTSTISGTGSADLGELHFNKNGTSPTLALARSISASMGAAIGAGDVVLNGHTLTLGGSTVTILARIIYADGTLDLQADSVDLESNDQGVSTGPGSSSDYLRGGKLFNSPLQGRIRFSGAGNVALAVDSLSWLTNLEVAMDDPSDTVTISGAVNTLAGSVIIEQGTLDLGTKVWAMNGSFVSNALALGNASLLQGAGGRVTLTGGVQRVRALSGRAGFDGALDTLVVTSGTWLGVSTQITVANLLSVKVDATLELLGGANVIVGDAANTTAGTFIVEENGLWLSNGSPTPSMRGASAGARFACIVQGEAQLNGLSLGWYDDGGLRLVDNAYASALNSVEFHDGVAGGVHITFRAFHNVSLGDPEFVNNRFDGTATRASVLGDAGTRQVSLRFGSDDHGVATKEELNGASIEFTSPTPTTLLISSRDPNAETLRLPGEDGVVVGTFSMRAAGSSAQIESLQLSAAVVGGAATTIGDVADAVWLVPDWNFNGIWDEGEDAFGGSGALASGSELVTFTGSPILGVLAGRSVDLMLIVDFGSADAVDLRVNFALLSESAITTTQALTLGSALPLISSSSRAVASAFNMNASSVQSDIYYADRGQTDIPSLHVAMTGERGLSTLSGITVDVLLNSSTAVDLLGPIHVYIDANGNGLVDAGENELVAGGTSIDPSQRTLVSFPAIDIPEGETVFLLLTLDSLDSSALTNVNYQMRMPINFNDTLYAGELTNAGGQILGSRVYFPTTRTSSSGCAISGSGPRDLSWALLLTLGLLGSALSLRRRA